jgi:integrase
MRLTDAGIRAARPRRDRYELVETGTGLAVRVSPKGIKTFCYLYRHAGKPRRLSLGIYRDAKVAADLRAQSHDQRGLAYLTLADARIKLAEARKLRDSGIDPGAPAVGEHRAERKAQTVGELIDAYLEKYARPNKRSAGQDERLLNKDVRPAWGSRKASSISRPDVVALLDDVVARGAPVTANRLLAVTRKMFRFAVRRGIVAASPVVEIDAPGGREVPRDRTLSDAELAEVWRAAGEQAAPYRQLVRLLILTGQRRGEVAGLRRGELDLAGKLWTIPRERTKNGLPQEVPLAPLALEIIAELPRKQDDEGRYYDHAMVSGHAGDRPICEFKGAKRRLDTAILMARKALEEAGENRNQAEPMPRWVLHDLRRSMRSGLSRLRIDAEIAERVIGHVPAGIRAVYDRHDFRDEKRAALERWAAHVIAVVDPGAAPAAEVVPLTNRRG